MSQALARALGLLEAIARGEATLGRLAETAQVHKSTVLRQLRTLEEAGYVHRTVTEGGEHRYAIGGQVLRLAQQALDSVDVRRVAAGRLRRLRDELGQTVHLAVFDGRVATYVDKLEPQEAAVRMGSRIGSTVMLHCTAVGKVFLAGLDPVARAELVASLDLVARTPATLTDAGALLAEVQAVAERGWAVDHAEDETYVNCVGAPVHGADGAVIGAASVSVPDVVLPYQDVLALHGALLAATGEVSRDCGFTGTPEIDPDARPPHEEKP